MTEIKISVEIGMSERTAVRPQLFGNVHKAVMPEVHTAQAVAAPAPRPKSRKKVKGREARDRHGCASGTKERRAPAQSAVTLPDLQGDKQVWNGGKNQSVTDAIIKELGASKGRSCSRTDTQRYNEALTAKAKELGR